jgi:hypothetical protein
MAWWQNVYPATDDWASNMVLTLDDRGYMMARSSFIKIDAQIDILHPFG